jgi:putative restriction endonuclease
MESINQTERAMLAWDVLARLAAEKKTITYAELASEVGAGGPRACRYFLDLIQSYCMCNQLPPLTILVVNKGKKKPGTGFVAHDVNALDAGMQSVWSYDWTKDGNPFDFSKSGESFKSLKKQLLDDPNNAESVGAKVKNRGMRQVLFREALIEAYGGKCAITQLAFPDLLEACHIVPWAESTPAQQVDVRNGILMNRLHHRMFDCGYMAIDANYDVHVDKHKDRNWGNEQVRQAIAVDLNGSRIKLPANKEHRPDPGLLEKHAESWGWTFTEA